MSNLVTYCERLGSSWTAEPFNTLSNLAFVLVAIKLWYWPYLHEDNNLHASRSLIGTRTGARTGQGLPTTLPALVLLVGMGSASYHAFPGYITLALDIIPILSIATVLCWLLLTRLCALNYVWATALSLLLVGCTLGMSIFSHIANGSLFYLPVWLTICALVYYAANVNDVPHNGPGPLKDGQRRHGWRQGLGTRPKNRLTSLLLVTFSVALFARTVDFQFCSLSGVGTHFIWHILAAVSVYLACKVLLLADF